MIKVNVKHKRNNEKIVEGTIKHNKTNKAELMVVIGTLSELAMKDYDITKQELVDLVKKRG